MNNDSISREYVKAKMFDIPKPKEGATFWDGVDTVGDIIDNAPTVKPCENCDLYFKAMTKEEMKDCGEDMRGAK